MFDTTIPSKNKNHFLLLDKKVPLLVGCVVIKELFHLYDVKLAWEESMLHPIFFFRMGENHSESLKIEKMIKHFSWGKNIKIPFYRIFFHQQEELCKEITRLTWAKKSFPQLLLIFKQELIWYKSGEDISDTNLFENLSPLLTS